MDKLYQEIIHLKQQRKQTMNQLLQLLYSISSQPPSITSQDMTLERSCLLKTLEQYEDTLEMIMSLFRAQTVLVSIILISQDDFNRKNTRP